MTNKQTQIRQAAVSAVIRLAELLGQPIRHDLTGLKLRGKGYGNINLTDIEYMEDTFNAAMRELRETIDEGTSAKEVMRLARKHVSLGGAIARLCLTDAVAHEYEGNFDNARKRALDSLRYSVGILHADYKRAAKGSS